ncbi:hypothetical protein [Aquipseudomonas ullengensis]|uniref:Uncharacterized protein n=1 Tax=Aquipseudomonas ullengensis TaxID=2759166 RepID=A0A7W4LKK5_9GAMM|nr:hypothetical protein [Pseudomonas ullengensis]MBB2494846.1 hypothetical protein [Pseudomonas ullengensis]
MADEQTPAAPEQDEQDDPQALPEEVLENLEKVAPLPAPPPEPETP